MGTPRDRPRTGGRATAKRKRPTSEAEQDQAPVPQGIVALGASAGGLVSIETLLSGLPPTFPWPVLVAQHMDPHARSHFVEIIARRSTLPVREASAGEEIQAGVVLVCPADAEMQITPERRIALEPPGKGRPARIDRLFASIAEICGPAGVAVILSGTGTDGAEGAITVKRRGGTVIAESEETARHPGMPNAAIQAGAVDLVRPVSEIPTLLRDIALGKIEIPPPSERDAFLRIVDHLKKKRGTSLDEYREPTLRRRIRKRMAALTIATMEDYYKVLAASSEETEALFETILINVTEFFRDPEAWEFLEQHVVQKLASRLDEAAEVRIWAAGCATGEEAYSLALLIAEALPNVGDWDRVKIFATDIDTSALTEARAGRYDISRLSNVSSTRLARFFERAGPVFEISKSIRRMVIFGVHDLTRDPPIGRLDLITCRNVLIYFDTPLQRRIFTLFLYALRAGGYLFLGKSEDLPRDTQGFDITERRHRLYTRRAIVPAPFPRLPNRIALDEQQAVEAATRETPASPNLSPLNALVLDAANLVVFITDTQGVIRYANRYARTCVPPDEEALEGRTLAEALKPGDALLRSAIESTAASTQRVRLGGRPFLARGRRLVLDLVLEAFSDDEGKPAVLVVGLDITAREEAEEALRDRARQLQEAIEALQTTNEELQSANEELVTANEELQSSNEELATLNEELQSSNEELETTNEELQSTNEELAAVNAELTRTAGEADRLSMSLSEVADVSSDAIILCDESEIVTLWGGRAKQLFGLHREDVLGRNVYSIDLQIPTDLLRELLSSATSSRAGFVESKPIRLRGLRGTERWVVLAVEALRTSQTEKVGWLLVVRDQTVERLQANAAARATQKYQALLHGTQEAVLVVETDGAISHATPAAITLLGCDPSATKAKLWDITPDRESVLKLKGALTELTLHALDESSPGHSFIAPLAPNRSVRIHLIPVAAEGQPPIVLLYPHE